MKTILVINDHSAASQHAAQMALAIARETTANILIANVSYKRARLKSLAIAGTDTEEEPYADLLQSLLEDIEVDYSFTPEVAYLDVFDCSEKDLAATIIKNNIWMVVKGCDEAGESADLKTINLQSVLNRVSCPLMIVPRQASIKAIERIVYTADLRYCRLDVVKYLAELANCYDASLNISHISADGLPNMEEHYASLLFKESIGRSVKYHKLSFNNTRERNMQRAVDVMIDGLKADMLVLVNHQYHLQQIVGRYVTPTLPENITVPLLIFPC